MNNYDNTNSGVLFINDKKGNDKAPDYKGKINVGGKDYDLAGWKKQGKNGTFLSLKVSEPYQKDQNDKQPKGTFSPIKNDEFTEDLPF